MDNLTPKEIADEEMINQAFHELLNDYLSTKHRKKVEIITKAFNFANQAHKGIKRRSGEPYIMHPIAVASIVCNEIGLGSTSICAALLHDVVEDTDYTVEDIENIFGPKIAQIVDGLTKISGGIFGDRASAQAENFKKLLLTMSNDIRVILIKIADRLHNMRTLGSMLPNKQYKIAGETLYIYAPLANRLGLYKIKTELENLSFKYEHPEEYAEIEENEVRFEELHCEDAEYLIVAFGSCARIAQKAMEMARAEGIKVGLLRPITLWPFPSKAIAARAAQVKGILTVELNAGQMVEDVRLAVACKVPVEHFGRLGGIVPDPDEVITALKEKLIK